MDQPAGLLTRLEVEAAEQVDARAQHADLLALGIGDHADRSHQFVLDRQSRIEERDHELLGPGTEDHPEENLVGTALRLVHRRHRPGPDAETLARLPRFRREWLGRDDVGVDLAAPSGIELAEQRDDVAAGLHVATRNLGAEIGLDEDGAIRVEARDQFAGVRGKRVQALRGGIQPATQATYQDSQARDRDQQRDPARGVVQAQSGRAVAGRPVAPAQGGDVQVHQRGGEAREVENPIQGDDSIGEVAELFYERQALQQSPQASANDVARVVDEDRHRAQQRAEDVGHGQVRTQLRGQHAQPEQAAPISQ